MKWFNNMFSSTNSKSQLITFETLANIEFFNIRQNEIVRRSRVIIQLSSSDSSFRFRFSFSQFFKNMFIKTKSSSATLFQYFEKSSVKKNTNVAISMRREIKSQNFIFEKKNIIRRRHFHFASRTDSKYTKRVHFETFMRFRNFMFSFRDQVDLNLVTNNEIDEWKIWLFNLSKQSSISIDTSMFLSSIVVDTIVSSISKSIDDERKCSTNEIQKND